MENINIEGFEVLTSEGYKDFTGIKRQTTDKTITIKFNNKSKIQCTEGHLLQTESDNFVEAHTLKVGDTVSGLKIKSIEYIDDEEFVYDLLNVKDTAHYITNHVTSHNCAFVNNWDDFSASVLPVLSSGKQTKMIFTSTPNGLNHFYRYYEGAKKGTNGFDLIEVKWYEVPGRDEAWKEETLQTLNYDHMRFAQEYCVSGDSIVTVRDKATQEIFDVSIEMLNEYMALDSKGQIP